MKMEKEIKERFEKIEKRVDKIEATLSKSSLSKSGKLVKCVHCGYMWRTQSKALFVSCSNCGQKTPIKPKKKKIKCAFCEKEKDKSKSVVGYGTYFCSEKCYQKYKKEAIKEVDKGLKKIL